MEMLLTVVIFSKDRACQAELCIRSLKEQFTIDKDIYCQYTSTNKEFQDGFDKVAKMNPDVKFIKESSFQDTLKSLLKTVKTEYLLCLTDDDVFVSKIDILEFNLLLKEKFSNKVHSAFSLRMNPNITRCYPANNKEIKAPKFLTTANTFFIWNWTEAENQHTCWGYPMAINGHIYRSKDIIPLIDSGNFSNANSLESFINNKRWFDKPYLISFSKTKVFNVQNNFVQGPRMGEEKYSVKFLNDIFLKGKIIDTDNIYGLEPIGAHGTIEYKFKE